MNGTEGMETGSDAPVSTTASRLFDLRTVLALLFVVYGLVLLVLGLWFTTPEDIAKAGGWNINLWTGVAMLAVAAVFITWVRLRPIRTDVPAEGTAGDSADPPAGPPGH